MTRREREKSKEKARQRPQYVQDTAALMKRVEQARLTGKPRLTVRCKDMGLALRYNMFGKPYNEDLLALGVNMEQFSKSCYKENYCICKKCPITLYFKK
jgi:hypothetical protein